MSTERVAKRHARRISAAVLIAAIGLVALSAAQALYQTSLPTDRLGLHRGLQRWALHWLFAETLRSGAAGRAQLEGALDDLMFATRCFDPRHAPKLIGPDVLSAADWGRIAVPTLILIGERERIYDPARAIRRLQAVAPQAQVGLIAGAGHDLTTLKAAEVGACVLAFLSSAG